MCIYSRYSALQRSVVGTARYSRVYSGISKYISPYYKQYFSFTRTSAFDKYKGRIHRGRPCIFFFLVGIFLRCSETGVLLFRNNPNDFFSQNYVGVHCASTSINYRTKSVTNKIREIYKSGRIVTFQAL